MTVPLVWQETRLQQGHVQITITIKIIYRVIWLIGFSRHTTHSIATSATSDLSATVIAKKHYEYLYHKTLSL